MDHCPLTDWNHDLNHIWKFNYIAMVASLLFSAIKDIKLNTNNELYNKIEGGNHLIYSLLSIDTVIKFEYCLLNIILYI